MALTFTGLRADPPRLNNAMDVIANLEADVSLEVNGEVIYDEVSFPVAELACALTRWSQADAAGRSDFEFDSMSAEERGLVWIRRVDGGWRLGSIDQEHPEPRVFSAGEIDEFVRKYVEDLNEQVETTFGPRTLALLIEALRTDQ
mgnify:CR=1 FL=1